MKKSWMEIVEPQCELTISNTIPNPPELPLKNLEVVDFTRSGETEIEEACTGRLSLLMVSKVS
jgi:hypothetical protein